MRKILALLGFLAFEAFGITNVTLPYLVDTASIPKVRYVDKNDSALKWGINNLGDTVNAATGTGVLMRRTGGTGVTLTSPTITTPTFTGTIASGLTASRTVITDVSGNYAVNTETGTGSHVRATSPTITTPTISGTLTGADAAFSTTLGVTGLSTLGRLNVTDSSITLGDGVTKGTLLTLQGKTGFTNPYLFNTTSTAGQLDITVNSGSNRSIGMTNTGAGVMSLVVEGSVTADSIISAKNQTRGTFTVTASGFTTTVSGTARWERNNETVTLCFPSLSGTSNQTFMQLTGIAAAIVPPTSTSTFNQVVPVTNSGTTAFGTFIWTPASATLDFKIDAALNPFTNSGTKGFSGFCSTYLLQ